jgi:hypothetical protein
MRTFLGEITDDSGFVAYENASPEKITVRASRGKRRRALSMRAV